MDKNNPPGFGARKGALKLLDAVLRRGQPLESALNGALSDVSLPADRALAHAIASETLRRIPDLDDMIDGATRQRLPDDSKARLVLRMALVQALILETPPHAVIATNLPLMDGGPRRLVHGVLGTLLRQGAKLRSVPMLLPAVELRWHDAWGQVMVDMASTTLASPPPVDLTLRDAAETEHWVKELDGESFAPGHVRVNRDRAIIDLPGFGEGAWWVQNIAASLPARLLGAGEGRSVLDLCAAPGGKTMQLVANGWAVTAVESSEARLVRMRENMERTGLAADLVCGDIFKWQPEAPVDAILLDAPCSATGIFARHPDVLHRVRLKDIKQLAEVQARMIQRVAGWLKPGGTLIYATCSLEPQEGEAHIETLAEAGLVLDRVGEDELPAGFVPNAGGAVRVFPEQHRDGFFIFRARRVD